MLTEWQKIINSFSGLLILVCLLIISHGGVQLNFTATFNLQWPFDALIWIRQLQLATMFDGRSALRNEICVNVKIFHCFYHPTWLPCKPSIVVWWEFMD